MNPSTTTLRAAQEWLEANREEGAACPCCHRISKVYFRRITRTMAKGLILLYFATKGGGWVAPPRIFDGKGVLSRGGDWAKLAYWGLIEQNLDKSNLYRVTDDGKKFVELRSSVQRIVRVLNGSIRGFEGDTVTIDQIMGVNLYESEMSKGGSP